jgi:GMP synthase (glutamine-hydrolysing)
MQRILTLQHVWENPGGYVNEILQEHGLPYDVVHVEAEPVPDPADYAAIVAFGGPQHVYDDAAYPYFAQEKALIRKAVELDIPYLGICLGGQLLASMLGSSVHRHSVTEIGFFDVAFTEEGKKDPLYAGLPGYQKVFHWHEDVFDLPAGAVQLATNENVKNQAFRYGKRAYGLQYHIEVNPEMMDTWLHYPDFAKEIIDTIGSDAYHALERESITQQAAYRAHTRMMFENFLRIGELI